jgi:hypothetical protein
MAISGIETINIGIENETIGSDSLYTAFNKTRNNFVLLSSASPYSTFNAGLGMSISSDSATGNVDIASTGVVGIVAGDSSMAITSNTETGIYTLVAIGGGGGGSGTVTSVGLAPVNSTRLTVTNSPIITSGTIGIDLATSGVIAGSYSNPAVSVDSYGRVTNIVSGTASGSVYSVGLTPGGFGISVTGGPITDSGIITVTNTGVTKISAGTGISVTGTGSGNVTVSTTGNATVSSVSANSTNGLVISGSPITTAGTITVDLPTNMTITGNITSANLITSGQLTCNSYQVLTAGGAANLLTAVSYFSTSAAATAKLAAGTAFQTKTFVMVADGGDMVITVTSPGWKTGTGYGTITFSSIGTACQLQYINTKWYCIGNNGAVFG